MIRECVKFKTPEDSECQSKKNGLYFAAKDD